MRRQVFALLALAVFEGCSRYAAIYVHPVDPGTQLSVPADVYSAIDGQFLGVAPMEMIIRQREGICVVPILLRHQDRQTLHELLVVTKWAATPADSRNNRNDFQFPFPSFSASSGMVISAGDAPANAVQAPPTCMR